MFVRVCLCWCVGVQLIERTSPELCPLLDSLKTSWTLVSSTLLPQLEAVQEVKVCPVGLTYLPAILACCLGEADD